MKPDPEAKYFETASRHRQEGSLDRAIALCQKVPPLHSDFPRTQLLLGKMFAEKGMNDLALETFREAMTNRPGSFDAESLRIYETLSEKPEEKPRKESRYEILEEIGRGAMGIVYKAQDRTLDRIVALKTLSNALKGDAVALANLMREAKTAAQLMHPNVVTIYDVGEEDGNFFIAMEWVEGKTLQQVLKQVKQVSLRDFLHIAKPLCDIVGFAHQRRIIHRDIKPSNILLLPSRTVKLMDFGLAKVLEGVTIDKTMLRGTPTYMSPEQILGKDIDHRTDLYSLGVVFYEMLAGTPPFPKGDILQSHLQAPPPPLGGKVRDVPSHVVNAIMKALSKKKADRPASAADFLQDLLGPGT